MGPKQGRDDLFWVIEVVSFITSPKTHKKGRKGRQKVLLVHIGKRKGGISLYLQVNSLERKGDPFCQVDQAITWLRVTAGK